MTAPDPLLSFLCTRNLIMREANERFLDEPAMDDLNRRGIALEALITGTPAVSVEGFAAKLMLHIEMTLEGTVPCDSVARALIREGRDTFAIGDFITPALELENAR